MKLMTRTLNPVPLFDGFDRLFEPMLRSPWDLDRQSSLASPVDLLESDTSYTVTADLPGVPVDAIEVSFEDGILKISGKREAGAAADSKYRKIERLTTLSRSIAIPGHVDTTKATASLANGVLTVTLPKTEKSVALRIPITTG